MDKVRKEPEMQTSTEYIYMKAKNDLNMIYPDSP